MMKPFIRACKGHIYYMNGYGYIRKCDDFPPYDKYGDGTYTWGHVYETSSPVIEDDDVILYDNLFKFVNKRSLRKLFMSMIPDVYYKNINKVSNKVYRDIKFGVMGDISSSIDNREYEIAYKLFRNIPKSIVSNALVVVGFDRIDIFEFILDIFALIYYNTDRAYLMSLLGHKYKGQTKNIKTFRPEDYKIIDLVDFDALDKEGIRINRNKDYLRENDPVIKDKSYSGITNYKIIYEKPAEMWIGDRLDQLDKETNPNSYIFMDMINVYAEKKRLQYVDAIYNIAISNPKIAADYIRKNKKVILGRVLKNVNTALKNKKLDITSEMLKFDNITVTNDCRLVCKLSLKAELAKEIIELTNQEKAILLYRKGLNRKEIAEKLGVTYQSACRYVRGM